MRHYRLYGLDLASVLALSHHVPEVAPAAAPPPDLTFELARGGPAGALPGAGDGEEVVYRSPERLAGGESVLTASRAGSRILLRYAGEASFVLEDARILGRPEPPGADGRALPDPVYPVYPVYPDHPGDPLDPTGLVELRLLGPVLACWLERSGLLALHAAAASVGGRAVALLAGNRGGKSCLAATLAAAGLPLLTDDVLALDAASPAGFVARPSYPQMRLRPEDARRFAGAAGLAVEALPRAHPGFGKLRLPLGAGGLGRFDSEPRPLAAVYLPERRAGGEVAIEPVAPREAVLALLAGSFLPRLSEALGWGARRLDLLARVVREVPVRRLVFPGGLDRLPHVRDALLDDLATLS